MHHMYTIYDLDVLLYDIQVWYYEKLYDVVLGLICAYCLG